MSQIDRRTLSLQLVPISVPDPPPVGRASPSLATWGALADGENTRMTSLCLCPGEVGEMLVRLEHRGDRPLNYRLQVNGSIPPSWYRLYTEGSELRREHPTEAVVRFCPEADFFEARQTLQPEQALKLDYQGEVRLHSLIESESGQEEQSGELLASETVPTAPATPQPLSSVFACGLPGSGLHRAAAEDF